MQQRQPQTIQLPLQVDREDLMPIYATAGAAGADLKASISSPFRLEPGAFAAIPTGIKVQIPEGYEIQIRPRSGLAAKHGITVLNAPGTIDSDFRGEICVILINHGKEAFEITPGMRIAQMVMASVCRAEFVSEQNFNETARGAGGFGHTGW